VTSELTLLLVAVMVAVLGTGVIGLSNRSG